MSVQAANKKFLIWGTGVTAEECFPTYSAFQAQLHSEIIGFITNAQAQWGAAFHGIPILSPECLKTMEYDGISVWADAFKDEILEQIRTELAVPEEKIQDIFGPAKDRLQKAYADSQDSDILTALYMTGQGANLPFLYRAAPRAGELPFGVSLNPHEVFLDESCGARFILVQEKRLYLKRSFDGLFTEDGKTYANSFWSDQQPPSPHLFESADVAVAGGDVLADAGAREGCFSLLHIDQVKRVYLIEDDPEWLEALRRTFAPYGDKVVFCGAALAGEDAARLDDLIPEPVDFLKLNVPGGAADVLRGAERLLAQNPGMKCAVCSPHGLEDAEAVQSVLSKNGFSTEVSQGFKLLLPDMAGNGAPELRREAVRAVKGKSLPSAKPKDPFARHVILGISSAVIPHYFSHTGEVAAIIDLQGNGSQTAGVPIISLETYLREAEYRALPIVITGPTPGDIGRTLREKGIDHYFLAPEVIDNDKTIPIDPDIIHERWPLYLKKLCDKPGFEVLEVGSRVVTGDRFRDYFQKANYTGFDLYEGENVDVTGDAHRLSSYFDKKFDLIFSSAVFEHFAMPWQVSLEMIKLLKPGGYVFVETHFAQERHEMPWHFFHFTENGLDVLFPEKFGMKCVKKGVFNLLDGRFSERASPYLRGRIMPNLYCHTEYLGRKERDLPDSALSWDHVSTDDVAHGTTYPKPRG